MGNDINQQAKPFIKWVGGKRQLLPKIAELLPKDLGTHTTTYVEPFLGGGAVLFHILNHYDMKKIWAGDLNRELIFTYQTIQQNPNQLIKQLGDIEKEYKTTNPEKQTQIFYDKRNQYNTLKQEQNPDPTTIATLFIFLNKTGFNGLYRVNKKGEYNVPHNRNPNPLILDKENLANVHNKTQNVTFYHDTYEHPQTLINNNTLIYVDPPYRPLTPTAAFTKYTHNDFNDTHQTQLITHLKTLANKGSKILYSNSDPKNINPDDNFFDNQLNTWGTIHRVQATRKINSNPNGRNPISEILFENYLPVT